MASGKKHTVNPMRMPSPSSAIKEISDTRCIDIDYSEKEVVAKLESLVDSCIAIGTGAIGKKIGLSASSTGNSSSKGEILKTKKWKDN
jgi:hypothetical protein